MYSAYKLNKQGDNIQPWPTPFPIWNQSVVPCPVLTIASWVAYRFSRDRSGGLVFPSLSEFSTVYCDPQSVNKAEIDVFLKLFSFFHDPADVGNLISGSSPFPKTSLNIWKLTVHLLLKPGLENFEHYFTSVWDECNCVVLTVFYYWVVFYYMDDIPQFVYPFSTGGFRLFLGFCFIVKFLLKFM